MSTLAKTEPNPVEQLARMVANSVSFQAEVRKYNETQATAHVHRVLAKNPDMLPRPFAVIQPGEISSPRRLGSRADGSSDHLINGVLRWRLAAEPIDRDDEEHSIVHFWEWAMEVFIETLSLSAYDDNLSILDGVENTQLAVMSHELGGQVVPYVWCEWSVPWGNF